MAFYNFLSIVFSRGSTSSQRPDLRSQHQSLIVSESEVTEAQKDDSKQTTKSPLEELEARLRQQMKDIESQNATIAVQRSIFLAKTEESKQADVVLLKQRQLLKEQIIAKDLLLKDVEIAKLNERLCAAEFDNRRNREQLAASNKRIQQLSGASPEAADKLEDTIRISSLLKEIENLRVAVQTLEESAATRSEERLSIDSLFRIGQHVRDRFLEASKPAGTKEAELIRIGNAAAHDANPLADATLYKCGYREDHSTYKNLYGVNWKTVLRLQNCFAFLQLVIWHGSVKLWNLDAFSRTNFYKALPRGRLSVFETMDLARVKEYLSSDEDLSDFKEYGQLAQYYQDEADKNLEVQRLRKLDRIICYECGGRGHYASNCV